MEPIAEQWDVAAISAARPRRGAELLLQRCRVAEHLSCVIIHITQLVQRYRGTNGVRAHVCLCRRLARPARGATGREGSGLPRHTGDQSHQHLGSAAPPAPSDLAFGDGGDLPREETFSPRSECCRTPLERAGCPQDQAWGWHSRSITTRSLGWPVAQGADRAPATRSFPATLEKLQGKRNVESK